MQKEPQAEAEDRLSPRQDEMSASKSISAPLTIKQSPLIFLSTFVLTIVILYFGQSVLIPFAFSLLLTFLLSPIVNGLERLRLGKIPSVILVVFLAFSLLGVIGWIVTVQLTTLVSELPQYQTKHQAEGG